MTVASFQSTKCAEGSDIADYRLQLVFGREKLCNYQTTTDCVGLNTLTSKKSGITTVNQFYTFFLYVKDIGGLYKPKICLQ